jgi:hypothetical protein
MTADDPLQCPTLDRQGAALKAGDLIWVSCRILHTTDSGNIMVVATEEAGGSYQPQFFIHSRKVIRARRQPTRMDNQP